MANDIKGGPDTDAAQATVTGTKAKTVTLSFQNEADQDLYDRLVEEAEAEERTLARYIVRTLRQLTTDNS